MLLNNNHFPRNFELDRDTLGNTNLHYNTELKPYDSLTESMTQQIYSKKSRFRHANHVVDLIDVANERIYQIGERHGLNKCFTNERISEFLGLNESEVLKPEYLNKKLEEGYSVKKLKKEIFREINKGKRYLPGFFVRHGRKTENSEKQDWKHSESVLNDIRKIKNYEEQTEPSFWERHSKLQKTLVFCIAACSMLPLAGCVEKNGDENNNDTDKDGLPDNWEMKYFGNMKEDGSGDQDHDFVNNFNEYKSCTNPTESYSVGHLNDFNRIFTYSKYITEISDKAQIEKEINEFLDKVPNVEPVCWASSDGGTPYSEQKYVVTSLNDPLFQYHANKIEIEWKNDSYYGRKGTLKMGEEPLYLGELSGNRSIVPPVCVLHKERKGIPLEVALTTASIFNYKDIYSHIIDYENTSLLETQIDGKSYIVKLNDILPKDKFLNKV